MSLRLDKYLKVARLIKRRTLAHDAADAGRVAINGRPAKPANDVHVGDRLTIDIGGQVTTVEVLEVREHVPAAKAATLYREISRVSKHGHENEEPV